MPDNRIPKALFFWRTGDWQTFGWCATQALQRHNQVLTESCSNRPRRHSKNWQPIEAAGGAPSDLAVSALRTEFMSPENNDVQRRDASSISSTVHHQTLPPYFLVTNVEEAVSPKLDYSATQDGTQRRRNNEDESVVPTAKPTTTIS